MELKTYYVVVDSCGIPILSNGDMGCPVWMHSTAKPIQLLPFLDRGLNRKYSLTTEEVVLLASSHLAQPQHVDALLSILRKTELDEDELILSPASPHGRISYRNWLAHFEEKKKRYHPCAGNHMAIMLLQRELTGRTTGYERIESPAQQEILQYIEEYTGVKPMLKKDNCGIPTYGVPLSRIAASYQKLATSSPLSSIESLMNAIHSVPVMLEGDGCISTVLCSDRNLIAKTGSNHLLAIGSQAKKIGLAIIAEDRWENVIQTLCGISSQIGIFNDKVSCKLKHITYS
ncbi:asparaginase [Dysosmobacter sp.]|uniref:asparaginase n=1 Tax=Dysosmobacter sp. TaxID=2591382 RepID=UPI002A8D469B|nr:asparaginase [Dysosmobacter sp.]MDY3983940.1 asparaginase [Dysosmobacter sp.]